MITTGTIFLPDGQTISAGQGGAFRIGGEAYPVTIIGWTESGKTIFYRHALTSRNAQGEREFRDDGRREILRATWRAADRCFRRTGTRKHGAVTTDSYARESVREV